MNNDKRLGYAIAMRLDAFYINLSFEERIKGLDYYKRSIIDQDILEGFIQGMKDIEQWWTE